MNVNGASRFDGGANEMAKYPMYLQAGENQYSGKKDQIESRFSVKIRKQIISLSLKNSLRSYLLLLSKLSVEL